MKTTLYILSIAFFLTSFFQMNETMAQQNTNELNIFPNPVASGQELKLELEVNDHQVVNFYVYDFAGKLVKESTLLRLGFGEQIIQLNMEIFDKGIYFVKVIIEDEITSSKISKVKKLYVI